MDAQDLEAYGIEISAKERAWLVASGGAEQGEKIGLEPVMLAKVRRIISSQGPAFHRALAHRVRIAFGLDNTPDLLPREFDALVRGGMTPLQAIQAATVNAAELLGQKDALGSVEKGKYADLTAIRGDPTKDVSALAQVVWVMKQGTVVRDMRARAVTAAK